MNYKVGDKVKIKSLDWHNENKDENNGVRCGNFTFYATEYCGLTFTIESVNMNGNFYIMKEIDNVWTDDMIECKVEDETELETELIDEYEELTDRAFKGGYEKCKSDIELNGFQLPEGYIFKDENGNVINAQKIVLETKKKKYPKTYEECSVINGCDNRISLKIIGEFTRLINARNAYWKLYGEEMGLGEPWKPDYIDKSWEEGCSIKYVIYFNGTSVVKDRSLCRPSYVLTFPTEEMRDEFYENFKKEIEICKELL